MRCTATDNQSAQTTQTFTVVVDPEISASSFEIFLPLIRR